MTANADDPFADPFADPFGTPSPAIAPKIASETAPGIPADLSAEISDPLLAPIPGDDPAGSDLRYDPVYDRIQEARRDDDDTAPQGIWAIKLKKADWAEVRDEAEGALLTRSKDLQLAAWLMEAWLQLDGLSGLVRGLYLIAGLSERFWPHIHPKELPEDFEHRLAPFYWIESRISERVGQVLITKRHGPEDAALSWQAMGAAQRLETMSGPAAEEYKQAVAAGALTLSAFTAAVRATSTPFYQKLAVDGQSALAELGSLTALLDRLCGFDSPSLSSLKLGIEQLVHFATRTLSDRGMSLAPRTEGEPSETTEAGSPTGSITGAGIGAGIRSRQHAYGLLAEIADWLAVTEPHSPTPFLIRRAISWGGMGLNELLVELIDEEASRRPIRRLLQMPDT